MRVIGGERRGARLVSAQGLSIRPTTDRVRESIFSILVREVPGAVVLDLFAGTGALSIEALSRGANRATLVEQAPSSIAVIERNIATTGLTKWTTLLKGDAHAVVERLVKQQARFDLIFADPPYASGSAARLVTEAIVARLLAGPDAVLVVEHAAADGLPAPAPSLTLFDSRTYGETALAFYRLAPEGEPA
jgi:16S rRNA (guanine966-N2)-methyltransferase